MHVSIKLEFLCKFNATSLHGNVAVGIFLSKCFHKSVLMLTTVTSNWSELVSQLPFENICAGTQVEKRYSSHDKLIYSQDTVEQQSA